MSDIENKQTISISNSSGVTMGNIENVVNASQPARASKDELAQVFALLLEKTNALPDTTDKRDAQTAIKELETEAKKSDQAEEKTVRKWLRFLLDTAPDIGQVAMDTFLNPVKGLSTVFQKVSERAKAERGHTKDG